MYLPEAGSNYHSSPALLLLCPALSKLLPAISCLCAYSPWSWQHTGIARAFLLPLHLLIAGCCWWPCCSNVVSQRGFGVLKGTPAWKRVCSCCFMVGICYQTLPLPHSSGVLTLCGQEAEQCVSCLLIRSLARM